MSDECTHYAVRRVGDSAQWKCDSECGMEFYSAQQVEQVITESGSVLAHAMTDVLWGLHQKALETHGPEVAASLGLEEDPAEVCESEGHDWTDGSHCSRCGAPKFLGA